MLEAQWIVIKQIGINRCMLRHMASGVNDVTLFSNEMDIPRKIVSLLGLFGAVTYEYKVSV